MRDLRVVVLSLVLADINITRTRSRHTQDVRYPASKVMTTQQFYDVPGGDPVTLWIADEETGYRQPIFGIPEDERKAHFRSISNITCRDDDILLNSYPKTGTNWLWEMLYMATKNTAQVSGDSKTIHMIEALPRPAIDNQPSPRILNTHLQPKFIPKEILTRKIKTILICRNPKDVAVSFYNHTKGIGIYNYDGKFDNYVEMFMRGDTDYGSYPDYLLEWQRFIREHPDHPVHIVYYEDLKKDCFGEMNKVVSFLELNIGNELLKEIVDSCHMSKIKDAKIKAMAPEVIEMFMKFMKDGFTVFRKGQIGDWKNWFTVAKNEKFETWWKEKAKDTDMFQFTYE